MTEPALFLWLTPLDNRGALDLVNIARVQRIRRRSMFVHDVPEVRDEEGDIKGTWAVIGSDVWIDGEAYAYKETPIEICEHVGTPVMRGYPG